MEWLWGLAVLMSLFPEPSPERKKELEREGRKESFMLTLGCIVVLLLFAAAIVGIFAAGYWYGSK